MLLKCADYHKVQKNVVTPSLYFVRVYQAMTHRFNGIAKSHPDPSNMLPGIMVNLDRDEFFEQLCPLHGTEMRGKIVQLASRLLIKSYCKRYTAN